MRTCDIREVACQQRIFEATACLRGVPAVVFPVRVIASDDHIRDLIVGAERNPAADRWARINDGLALLGLARAGAKLVDAVHPGGPVSGGFFDPPTRSVAVILPSDEPLDSPEVVATLVHEYTHGLQNEAGHLAKVQATEQTHDQGLAVSAVIEGEARIIEYRALLGMFERAEADIPWDKLFARVRAEAEEDASAAPLPVHRVFSHFSYRFGAAYVHAAFAREGLPGIDKVWASLPVSTRQVMAAYGATEPTGAAWLEDLGADA